MVGNFREKLVTTLSEDGWRMDGALFTPRSISANRAAVICVPGLHSAFYDSPYPEIGRELAGRGYAFIVGNTRGHDFGAVLRRKGGAVETGGGAWERFTDSVYDVAGWVDFAAGVGFAPLVLFGHSMGARKAAYYQSQRRDERIRALVVASGYAGRFRGHLPTLALARAMVSEGRGRDLMPWTVRGPVRSAQTYLDEEDPESPFLNIFSSIASEHLEPAVSSIRCPILVFFGALESLDPGCTRASELATIKRNAFSASTVTGLLIEGADHWYTGREAAVAETVADWLARLIA